MSRHTGVLCAFLAVELAGGVCRAGPADVQHPFILWTADEAAAIRRRMATRPWMKQSLDRLAREAKSGPFVNLFRYQVLGDAKAGAAERKYLLTFVGAPLDGKAPDGMRAGGHYDNYLNALRYDVLYDSLTAEQRTALAGTFRRFVRWELDHPYHNTRLSLLPNMQLPRRFAAHLMSLVLRDEKLIRAMWAAPSGFKWYFDEYLSDGGFYNEEFAKMTSLMGELLLYCRGLDRLGLGELGYGFRGRGGATMRSYLASYLWIGYPKTVLPGGRDRYERVAMGDARGHMLGLFQHANVPGYLPATAAEADKGGYRSLTGSWEYFYAANMNGRDHRGAKVEKLNFPQWFEIAHAKYPDGPFGYFLARMRRPGDDVYVPTPFWELEPIDPKATAAPPAPSAVYPQRGLAMLRAEESPGYWASPAPAVAMQLASLYVHYTSDCFSLLGYHAYNRPIYLNRAISAGYNGGPWDFSVRGHCGVVVDAEQAQPIGPVPVRHDFSGLVKFVSARGVLKEGAKPYVGRGEVRSSDQPRQPFTDVYSNVDLSRSLFLTRQYLFDVYQLADKSGQRRRFYWLVHAPGVPASEAGWAASDDLQNTLFNIEALTNEHQPRQRSSRPAPDPGQSWLRIAGEKKRALDGEPADVTVVQACILPDVGQSVLGRAWYDRKVGLRVRMLGEPGTTAFVFHTPVGYRPGALRSPRSGGEPARPETGGVSIAIAREAPRTIFAALHEPFENGTSRIERFSRIAQTDDAVAVAVVGPAVGVNDRAMVRVGDKSDQPLTLAGQGESFTFVGHAMLRIGAEKVEAVGDLRAMKLKVAGRPKLVVRGRDRPARVDGGYMILGGD